MRGIWLLWPLLFSQALHAQSTTAASPAPTVSTAPALTIPTLQSRVEPKYPLKELREGVEGAVIVCFLVDSQGLPLQVSVVRSNGITAFEQAAVAAVKQWRFAPARDAQGHAKISNLLQVQLQFKIDQ